MPVTVWKGQLTFGLVSIPIRVIRAARQERIRFTQVYRPEAEVQEQARSSLRDEPDEDLSAEDIPAAVGRTEPVKAPERVERVQHQYVAPDSGKTVPMREVLKGYEYERDHFAVFHPQEMRKFRAETTRDMEILEFVKQGIDPVFFNASYYVAPDHGGEKPYSLLFEAMRRSAYAAIARFAMHGREQMLTLRPGKRGILMHTLFYQTEIHAEDEFSADASLVTPQEMKMAELLISQLAADFDASKFKNEHKARLEAAIDARIAKGEASSERNAGPIKAAPVVDILDALRRSLERKPPAREAAAKKRPKQRKAGA